MEFDPKKKKNMHIKMSIFPKVSWAVSGHELEEKYSMRCVWYMSNKAKCPCFMGSDDIYPKMEKNESRKVKGFRSKRFLVVVW